MIKILTKKQWNALTDKVDAQAREIQRLRAEIYNTQKSAVANRESNYSRYLEHTRRMQTLEQKVRSLEKQKNKKNIWQSDGKYRSAR